MLLTFKQKLNLTNEQIKLINNTSNEGRLLYNKLLQQKQEYFNQNKKQLSYYEQQKQLKDYKCEYLTYDMKKEICRLSVNNFKSFFMLWKQNKDLNPRPPKFRGRHYFFTLSFTQDFILKNNVLIISNLKTKKIKIPFKHIFNDYENKTKIRNKSKNILKQLKIIKEDNEYYACIMYEKQDKQINQTNKVLSIDLGKKNIITYYDNETNHGCTYNSNYYFKNQKYYDKRIDQIKGLRDKKKKGSRLWKKLNNKKRKLELKKNRQNKLSLHILSKNICKLDRDIIIGDLTNLKHNIISDYKIMNRQMQNNWQLGIFINQLEYKSKKYGRKLVKINEAYTSKTCCHCGSINNGLTPSDRTYICEDCGFVIDRDINGAINIVQRYKQTELGDYSAPNWESLNSHKRFFGNIQKMNKFSINLY